MIIFCLLINLIGSDMNLGNVTHNQNLAITTPLSVAQQLGQNKLELYSFIARLSLIQAQFPKMTLRELVE